jgi:hypothetical protein
MAWASPTPEADLIAALRRLLGMAPASVAPAALPAARVAG